MRKMPNPVDIHVGGRLRVRRMIVGMSQEKLGVHLGLTFQQVQKYEKGLNRIGASRLYAISRILNTPVQYFFDDLSDEIIGSNPISDKGSGAPNGAPLSEFLATSEGLQLNMSFTRIKDQATRRRLADLVRTLADENVA